MLGLATRIGTLTFAATLLLAGGCKDELPTAPSEVTTGLVIYQHANFGGESAHVTADVSDLRDVEGPCYYEFDCDREGYCSFSYSWNDCASSVRVAAGWRATLYEHPNYKGWAADVGDENVANYQDVPGPCSLDTFNDCASSIRVFRVR